MNNDVKVLQVSGYHNSGKTTLIEKMTTYLKHSYELNIFTIKHSKEPFIPDVSKKDTVRHRRAGACGSLIQSSTQLSLTADITEEMPVSLLMERVQSLLHVDFFIVEGFKRQSYPKIVIIRDKDQMDLLLSLAGIELILFWSEKEKDQFHKLQSPIPCALIHDDEFLIKWLDLFLAKKA